MDRRVFLPSMASGIVVAPRGVSPAGIPIERPARFELIVNRRAATSLALAVPRSLLARADKVIE
jgi:putative ABC transport system substrate-binding protein